MPSPGDTRRHVRRGDQKTKRSFRTTRGAGDANAGRKKKLSSFSTHDPHLALDMVVRVDLGRVYSQPKQDNKLSIASAYPSKHSEGPSREQESESARLLDAGARLMSTEQRLCFFFSRTYRRTKAGQHSTETTPDR